MLCLPASIPHSQVKCSYKVHHNLLIVPLLHAKTEGTGKKESCVYLKRAPNILV